MTAEIESPKQLPSIYLDQNALSMIVNDGLEVLKEGFKSDKYHLVYSDETINEILRCSKPDFHKKALDVLAEMNGLYLKINDDESATTTNIAPHQLFEEAKNRDASADQNINAMYQFMFKLFGGRQGENFEDVLDDQKKAFEGLMGNLKKQVRKMQEDGDANVDVLLPFVDLASGISTEAVNSSIDQLTKKMNESIPDPEDFDGPKAWQEQFGVGAEQLNNIEPPKVIEQIWEQLSSNIELPETVQSLNDFLAPFYGLPQDDNNPTWAAKIRGLYIFLNFAGYWPDQKRRQHNKFIGALSDMNHAVYGAYANVVISEDVRFVKKVFAIYEYLGISTQVLQIVRKEKEALSV